MPPAAAPPNSPLPSWLLALLLACGLALPAIGGDGQTDVFHPGGDATVTLALPGRTYVLVNSPVMTDSEADAFEVTAIDVVLDLNGNTVTGTGNPGAGRGVDASGANVRIQGGTIAGFSNHGIVLDSGGIIQDVTVRNNLRHGISADGEVVVSDVTSRRNTEIGIAISSGVIRDSISEGDGAGVSAETAVVERVSVRRPEEVGIELERGSVSDSAVFDPGITGIRNRGGAVTRSTVLGSLADPDDVAGGDVEKGGGSQVGIVAATVEGCTVSNIAGLAISARVARDNQVRITALGRGIAMWDEEGGTVAGNTVTASETSAAVAGIEADETFGGRIENNHVTGIGDGAGILLRSDASGMTVGGNTTIENLRGIEVRGTGNVLIRNVSRGNTDATPSVDADYEIAVGNDVAPITAAAAASHPFGNIE